MFVFYEFIWWFLEDYIVVFVIDQVCEYEGVVLWEKMELVISVLMYFIKYRDLEENSVKRGLIVKFFLICCMQVLYIGLYFGRDEILNLEEIEEDIVVEWIVQYFVLQLYE